MEMAASMLKTLGTYLTIYHSEIAQPVIVANSKFSQMMKERVFMMRLKVEEWILHSASATFKTSSSFLNMHFKTISL